MYLFLVAHAVAHVPHQTVAGLAIPQTFSEEEPWWILVLGHQRMLERSDDQGQSASSQGVAPIGDKPSDIALLRDGTLILLGERAWWSSPDGQEWASAPLPGNVALLAMDGDGALLGGSDGLWRVVAGAAPSLMAEGRVEVLSDGDVASGVFGDGQVFRVDNEEAVRIGRVLPDVLATAASSTETFAGTAAGSVWRIIEHRWAKCAPFDAVELEHPEVVALALDADGAVLAATASGGLHHSVDGCETWNTIDLPVKIVFGGTGSPATPSEAVRALAVDGEAMAWGGWVGAWFTENGGESWRNPQLLPVDYARSVALTATGTATPLIWAGVQGSGPAFSSDGGATWTSPSRAAVNENVQTLAVDRLDDAVVYAMLNHHGFVSDDVGERWNPVVFESAEAVSFTALEQGCYARAASRTALHETEDCGATWVEVALPLANSRGAERWAIRSDSSGCFVAFDDRVWCGLAALEEYELAAEFQGETYVVAGVWLGESRYVFASGAQVWTTDDPFAEWVPVLELAFDSVVSLAMAEDGSLFLGTLGGKIWRSLDGGTAWEAVPGRTTGPIAMVVPRDRFAEADEVVVATLDGLFVVSDATNQTPALQRMVGWQRIDDSSGYFRRDGCPASDNAKGAGLGLRTQLSAGCSLTASFRGDSLRLWGWSDGQSVADVRIDGQPVGAIGDRATDGLALLASVELENGWHQLEIVGLGVGGLYLDGVDASAPGAVLTSLPVESEGGPECGGCGHSGGLPAGAGVVTAALLGRARRKQSDWPHCEWLTCLPSGTRDGRLEP